MRCLDQQSIQGSGVTAHARDTGLQPDRLHWAGARAVTYISDFRIAKQEEGGVTPRQHVRQICLNAHERDAPVPGHDIQRLRAQRPDCLQVNDISDVKLEGFAGCTGFSLNL